MDPIPFLASSVLFLWISGTIYLCVLSRRIRRLEQSTVNAVIAAEEPIRLPPPRASPRRAPLPRGSGLQPGIL